MSGEERRSAMVATNRMVETVAFLIGVLGLGLHMVADSLAHVGFRLGPCVPAETSIPWVVIVASVVLILPKTIGRARAGAIVLAGINALTLRLTGKGAATAVLTAQHGNEASRPVAVATVPEGGGTAVVTMEGDATGLADQHAGEIARAGKARQAEEAS